MADGLEDATCPDSEDVKEVLLRFMRSSTTLASSTTASSMELRIQALANNRAVPPKQLPHVFPEFQPAEAPSRPRG